MTDEFTRLDLHLKLVLAVTDPGYATPAPIQSQAIPLMLAGHDVNGRAWATAGAGKYRIRKNAVTLEIA